MRVSHILGATAAVLLFAAPASAEFVRCTLTYNLDGWSFLYKQYSGTGRVTCSNGENAPVIVRSRGGGITFGKTEISEGRGTFSEVRDMSEVFGTYAAADAHAGAVAAVESAAMTKGPVSLALSGKGRGFNLGFSFSGFTIRRK